MGRKVRNDSLDITDKAPLETPKNSKKYGAADDELVQEYKDNSPTTSEE